MAQIRVEALDKSFGTFHAVRAASFTVEESILVLIIVIVLLLTGRL